MHLLLVAGYWGSGKTAFVVRLADAAPSVGQEVPILVNQISQTRINDRLMRQLNMVEWEVIQ